MNKEERNYGIDILRIFMMFCIVLLHILGIGGVIESIEIKNISYYVLLQPIYIFCYCAVDVYALISGYVNVKHNVKISKIVTLWMQTVFYSVLISIILFIVFENKVTTWDLFRSFLPLLANRYWYFTAYFGLFFIIPIINSFFKTARKENILAIVFIAIVFIVLPSFSPQDIWNMKRGYSVLWLTILYILGGAIRIYEPFKKIKTKILIVMLFLLIQVTNVLYSLQQIVKSKYLFFEIFNYDSIFITSIAILLIEVFSRININKNELKNKIVKLSSLTFSVFLIHSHALINEFFITNGFAFLSKYNTILIVILSIIIAFTIFIVCLFIDYIRQYLFVLLNVNRKVDKLCNYLFRK